MHVSPAGSKIEYITLTSGCPEGWALKGAINADKSFRCAPIPDASAPTNLIHCIDGMKYFVKDGHVGCRHPPSWLAGYRLAGTRSVGMLKPGDPAPTFELPDQTGPQQSLSTVPANGPRFSPAR